MTTPPSRLSAQERIESPPDVRGWSVGFKCYRPLVAQRFTLLQHMLYPLQRLLLAAQPQEFFPLQLKQILLTDQRPGRDVTAGHNVCNCPTQHLLIFGDEAAHPHVPELGLDAGRNTPAGRLQIGQRTAGVLRPASSPSSGTCGWAASSPNM